MSPSSDLEKYAEEEQKKQKEEREQEERDNSATLAAFNGMKAELKKLEDDLSSSLSQLETQYGLRVLGVQSRSDRSYGAIGAFEKRYGVKVQVRIENDRAKITFEVTSG